MKLPLLLKKTAFLILSFAAAVVAVDLMPWFHHQGFPAPHLKNKEILFARAGANRKLPPKTSVLLVNGAIAPHKNHPRYWNNLSLYYSMFKSLGAERIRALSSDGLSPEPDGNRRAFLGMFSFADDNLRNTDVDLDGDGRPDVDGDASKRSLLAALEDLGTTLTAGSHLVIFITDHGQLRRRADGAKRAALMLWGGEISGAELNGALKKYVPPAAKLTLIATQCYSGLFAEEIDRPNTTLISATGHGPAWSNQEYNVFPYFFAEGLLEKDIATGAAIAAPAPASGATLDERFAAAFEYAVKKDHLPEWPTMRRIP